MTLPPQTRIRIIASRTADIAGKTGTITKHHEGGYAVRLDGTERVVWCEQHEVEKLKSEDLHIVPDETREE